MVDVPNRSWWDPVLGAELHTGTEAVEAGLTFSGGLLATDCETPGLGSFDINCVTMAWEGAGRVHAILLDPRRLPSHAALAAEMYRRADRIVLHNAPFDVPILWHAGLLDSTARIVDTLLLARMAYPDLFVPKSLTALVERHLGMTDFGEGMKVAFKAAGYGTVQAGYEGMDIDSPIYRLGAMADTVATLKLEPVMRAEVRSWLTTHPFEHFGAMNDSEADEIIAMQNCVNRVMLRRSAIGLAVDTDYLLRYAERVEEQRQRDETALAAVGLEGGMGRASQLITYLGEAGQLREDWPLTPTGKLKATKDLLDELDHPLAHAQRRLADVGKITGYISKVSRQAAVTGRCHPQVAVLGACQTGRWSVSSPELHQFAADARPIIVADGDELWSVDWSQIEPVMLGNMAGGTDPIIRAYESGDDLYEPIQRSAGVDRKTAKVVLLGSMYGMGVTKLARGIGHTAESAAQIRRQMFAAMPQSARFMSKVQSAGEKWGKVITVGGRILPVDRDGVFKAPNHVIQGSAADQLCAAVCAIDAAGLSDVIRISMHDELVLDCDAETAAEVERIMQQPHPNLKMWSGRDAVLRTDKQSTGKGWQKV